MSARYYLAWRMAVTAAAQDKRNKLRSWRTKCREAFVPYEDLSDNEFRNRYRLTKEAFLCLCEELRHLTDLKSTQRVSLETKVLTALFFYASGSYQRPVGVAKNLSQKTCSEYIDEVTQALLHPNVLGKHIQFPITHSARHTISHKFFVKYGIPGIIGAIDGSHFKIFGPPAEDEHLYFSRKQYHSINVLMVCDSEYRIIYVNPKFGGANHDSFIWENSSINSYIQDLHQSGEMVWLLGDSGFPLRPWLITPFMDAVSGSPEASFNDKHISARVVIENTFGRLKNRWRCLSKDRVLHYKPDKCAKIIQACCVLYNIALKFRVPDPEGDLLESRDEPAPQHHMEHLRDATTDLMRGRAIRQQLVRRIQRS